MRIAPASAREIRGPGIPDMRYINRQIPIVEVARKLDLRLDGPSKIHCWHPDRHQHGDRTASVGVHRSNNTAKCFGCDSKPMGPIDLVMDVLNMSQPADAALWIAARFAVPSIPRRRPNRPLEVRHRVGYEQGLGLLVRSGLWGTLSEAARCIAPVLLDMAEKPAPAAEDLVLQMSYVGIARFSGVHSHRAIRKALVELAEIGFLRMPSGATPRSPERTSSRYVVTPLSEELRETANAFAAQQRTEIAAEKELRKRACQQKIHLVRGAA
jgi:hypothetical protein